ncbi:uncharacterized protein LOC123384004 isoform X2 [Felis catus]|uniref:uncharacterized protein LOC123384004 isoform X2 n=1 Tax=Felis catus TaxID=9685 RepID=UPI001D1A0E36|nr:uncharacterized protein LOC123384004 isoform X2 [Felis catus]
MKRQAPESHGQEADRSEIRAFSARFRRADTGPRSKPRRLLRSPLSRAPLGPGAEDSWHPGVSAARAESGPLGRRQQPAIPQSLAVGLAAARREIGGREPEPRSGGRAQTCQFRTLRPASPWEWPPAAAQGAIYLACEVCSLQTATQSWTWGKKKFRNKQPNVSNSFEKLPTSQTTKVRQVLLAIYKVVLEAWEVNN